MKRKYILKENDSTESIDADNIQVSKNASIKVEFNGYYSEKSKKFDGGLYPILEYIKDNKLKNVIVRLDYDKKNTTSWDEVDLYCSELSIKKLSFSISDTYPKYIAYIECNRKYVRFLIKMLIQMALLGNGGHSYGILINDKQFNFDGDGADHISSINDIKINNKVYSDTNKQIDIYNKSLNNDKNMNENKKNMKRNVIRLTESDLHRVIKESVKNILKEYKDYYHLNHEEMLDYLDEINKDLKNTSIYLYDNGKMREEYINTISNENNVTYIYTNSHKYAFRIDLLKYLRKGGVIKIYDCRDFHEIKCSILPTTNLNSYAN